MSKQDARFESLLFDYETTIRTDFRPTKLAPDVKTVYKSKPSCLRAPPLGLKDLHALTDWKVPNVPFNLMHKPKEIVQTNPRAIQEPYFHPVDELHKEVQKTRPRLVMTPAASLDDASDSDRELLVRDKYLTTLMKVVRDSRIPLSKNVRAPLSPVYAPAEPIKLDKLQAPYVSPEWRMDSAAWDGGQLRADCDPTKYFWLARSLK